MADPLNRNRRYTFEEYLRIEEISGVKHEFIDGIVFPVGSPPPPVPIPDAAKVFTELSGRLQSLLSPAGVIAHVVEGPNEEGVRFFARRTLDGDFPTEAERISDPSCVVMLTSNSTFSLTYHKIFDAYRQTGSVAEVTWIFADHPYGKIYRRKHDATWLVQFVDEMETEIHLRSIGVRFRLGDVYAGATFPFVDDPLYSPRKTQI
jgi:Uma2 family endonuclease